MTGHEYEHAVAAYLRSEGYSRVKVTKGSGDYGVDVVAFKHGFKYAVQCKYYTSPVGLSAVQEVYAGKAFYNCEKAMVVTNSTFTKAAEELARKNGVILVSGITGDRRKRRIHWLKILLIAVYLFFLTAAVCAAFEAGKKISTWMIIYDVFVTLLFFAVPVAVVLLIRYVRNRIISAKIDKMTDEFRETVSGMNELVEDLEKEIQEAERMKNTPTVVKRNADKKK